MYTTEVTLAVSSLVLLLIKVGFTLNSTKHRHCHLLLKIIKLTSRCNSVQVKLVSAGCIGWTDCTRWIGWTGWIYTTRLGKSKVTSFLLVTRELKIMKRFFISVSFLVRLKIFDYFGTEFVLNDLVRMDFFMLLQPLIICKFIGTLITRIWFLITMGC